MTRGPSKRPARLLEEREVCELYGWTRWRLARAISHLGEGPWLVRRGRRKYYNLSYLRAKAPEMFEALEAPSDLERLVEDLRERVAMLEKRDRAKGAAIRELRARLATEPDDEHVEPYSVDRRGE